MARQDSPIASEAQFLPGETLVMTISVAGDEDPGASIDLVEPRAANAAATRRRARPRSGPS